MKLNERIAAWRKHVGMRRSTLAKHVGVSWEAAHQWECGDTQPTHENLAAVAAAFGISMSQFWGEIPATRNAS